MEIKSSVEAINYEVLKHLLPERRVNSLFEQVKRELPISEALVDYLGEYSRLTDLSFSELLRSYDYVKSCFESHPPQTIISIPNRDFPFLYLRGDTTLLERKRVTVVGTKTPSLLGKYHTKKLVEALSEWEIPLLAGISLGVEGSAHINALKYHLPTIGVLETPLHNSWPKEHEQLQKVIEERGLIISPFSGATESKRWHFALRNRLISALSPIVVIVEERDGGPALKIAQYSLEAGATVALFEHTIKDRSLLWPRKLSRKGEIILLNPNSIEYETLIKGEKRERVRQLTFDHFY